eukprot:gnl/Chilomastix_cuspidata/4352.p1 GENE.gnl/Chilomastix_cuspidata/4352~~gnl/Chilomastix_cuspidata/4352.p1  ORF type:complete len:112 (-),score=36.02 gnl/Chilomastix_cuspidata/4352:8-343(-)
MEDKTVPPAKKQPPAEPKKIPAADAYDYPLLPVTRIAQAKLPEGAHISADTKLALQKAASIMVFRLVHEANKITLGGGRAKITPADVTRAARELGVPGLDAALETRAAAEE